MFNQQNNAKTLVESLDDNIRLFKGTFIGDDTFVIRQFQNKFLKAAKCCIFYIDGMVNSDIINKNIIQPLLNNNLSQEISSENLLEELQYKVINSNSVIPETNLNKIFSSLISGDTIFMLDGYNTALIISSKGWKTRPISEPETEKVVRGPREGFTESILMNISLVRRKIKNPNLKFKHKEIGETTHTKVCICYIEDIASKNIIGELEKRLAGINIDGILDSGYIQEFIRDAPFSPFNTVGRTERPDVIAAKILEGRIAVLVDGSPVALTVPYIMVESAQTSEDYYNNYIDSSLNRIMRSFSPVLAASLPSIFLALVTFHQEMLPTPLLLNISASRQGVPFPTVLSLFVMLIVFDILREAGTRMPMAIGQAVNIVGALVLGQAAVDAKLVSAPVIIITAMSGILTLLNINMVGSIIIVRMILLLLTSILGVYGLIFGAILVLLHLLSIRSFGVPYLMNQSTFKDHNAQDTWIRAPWWSMTLRPKIIAARNLTRQSTSKNRRK